MQTRSGSKLFLLELIIDILLFALLCGCGLTLLGKSTTLSEDTTNLHWGVSLCNNVAATYKSGESYADIFGLQCTTSLDASPSEAGYRIYYNKDFAPCSLQDMAYYIDLLSPVDVTDTATISFYTKKNELVYSITVHKDTPLTLEDALEVDDEE